MARHAHGEERDLTSIFEIHPPSFFIKWISFVLWAFTFTWRVAVSAPFLQFDYYFFEDVCIWSSGYVKLRPAPYPLVNRLEGSFAIRQV